MMKKYREYEKNTIQNKRFYRWGIRLLRRLYRVFVRRFSVVGELPDVPAVFVARHMNLHGPMATLPWMPIDLHPLVLSVFLDRKSCYRQYAAYTFTARREKKSTPGRRLLAHVAARFVPPLLSAIGAIPVHRGEENPLPTLRAATAALLRGESVILFPDVDYTDTGKTAKDIYDGFLYLGEMYRKRTGRSLPFIPLAISESNRTITVKAAVFIDRFRDERDRAREEIRAALSEE